MQCDNARKKILFVLTAICLWCSVGNGLTIRVDDPLFEDNLRRPYDPIWHGTKGQLGSIYYHFEYEPFEMLGGEWMASFEHTMDVVLGEDWKDDARIGACGHSYPMRFTGAEGRIEAEDGGWVDIKVEDPYEYKPGMITTWNARIPEEYRSLFDEAENNPKYRRTRWDVRSDWIAIDFINSVNGENLNYSFSRYDSDGTLLKTSEDKGDIELPRINSSWWGGGCDLIDIPSFRAAEDSPGGNYGMILIHNELIPGDANGNGMFNQLDLVQVLSRGSYRVDRWTSWSDGDWNADGRFDQLDLVAALAAGGYGQASVSALTVPEPSSLTQALISVVCCMSLGWFLSTLICPSRNNK